ncbi:YecA family protein [Frigoriglobus tundricola]|uniref:SEC-C motif domain protein n=1 Tax=Frigoriglobus tundricola TaxID=2774151 RepID=A0A6M5YSC0_9BACT|nr:SEC-C metal-binding domain-containing protein [Frigoriglobus tundricola]QJW96945.1 hypothetical protein FTUN_4505 [Frigoriglobus tundricola]
MKAGRNDPCPCGSGKKYKKCCAAKDQEDAAKRPGLPSRAPAAPAPAPPKVARAAFPPLPPPPPPPPRSPLAQRGDARWQEYESQTTGEGRVAVFLATLEDALDGAAVMTDDLAFEMLNQLHADAAGGNRTRFAECVAALRGRRPEVFERGAHFYLDWCLRDALADGRSELVLPLARELAGHAGGQIDTFNRTLDALEYHGQLPVLVETMRIAWPGVKSATDIFGWAVSEFADRGVRHEVFNYLERVTAPDPADPALLDRVRFFVEEPRDGYLRDLIDDLSGKSGREWHTADFDLRPPQAHRRDEWDDEDEWEDEEDEKDEDEEDEKGEKGEEEEDEKDEKPERRTPDPGAVNLGRLIHEFVGYLRHAEGVPFTQGELVGEELFTYLVRRHEGALDPRPSMFDLARNPNAKTPKPPPPAPPLCPERVTLDAHLGGLLGMMSGRFHAAAALFQRVPAWLRFLETRRLIDAGTRRKVADELLPLHATLLKLWQDFPDDPALYRQQQAWPADAAKEPAAPAT